MDQKILQLLQSNRLTPKAKQALMSALTLMRNGHGKAPSPTVTPGDLASYSGNPNMATLPDGSYQISPTTLASMVSRRDAAQAKQDKLPSIDDFQATPLLNNTPADLARSQYVRGGADAAPILDSMGSAPTLKDGRIDYSGVNPVQNGDQLTKNPKFQALAQADPQRAAHVYQALTGGDFTADQQSQQKQDLARTTDFEKGIREGFISGNLRRHPKFGWLERRRMTEDPMHIEPPTVNWEPVDAVMQQADADLGKRATGYGRPGVTKLIDAVPLEQRNAFIQKMYDETSAGKSDRDAIVSAADYAKSLYAGAGQLATLQTAPGAKPVAAPTESSPTLAPTSVPAPTANYPEQAAANAIKGTVGTGLGALYKVGVPAVYDAAAGAGNLVKSLGNLPSSLVNFAGAMGGADKPLMEKPFNYAPFSYDANQIMRGVGDTIDNAYDAVAPIASSAANSISQAIGWTDPAVEQTRLDYGTRMRQQAAAAAAASRARAAAAVSAGPNAGFDWIQ